jgi:hypothetical protein
MNISTHTIFGDYEMGDKESLISGSLFFAFFYKT